MTSIRDVLNQRCTGFIPEELLNENSRFSGQHLLTNAAILRTNTAIEDKITRHKTFNKRGFKNFEKEFIMLLENRSMPTYKLRGLQLIPPDSPVFEAHTLALVYTSWDSPPFLIIGGDLPSMCGGAVFHVIDVASMSAAAWDTVMTATNYGYSWTGECYSEEEYDEEYDEYTEGELRLTGLLGQILMSFDVGCHDARKQEFYWYMIEQLKNHSGNGLCDSYADVYPTCTSLKWFGDSMLGLFTEYSEVLDGWDFGLYGAQSHSRDIYAQRAATYSDTYPYACVYNESALSTCSSPSVEVSTYFRGNLATVMEEEPMPEPVPVREFLNEHMGNALMSMLRPLVNSHHVTVLTDNCGAIRTDGIRTKDVIYWLTDPSSNPERDELLFKAGSEALGLSPSRPKGIQGFAISPFPLASNPNEGAHQIMGVAIHRCPESAGTNIFDGRVYKVEYR